MRTFAEKIIDFYSDLDFYGKLPTGISIMNPFKNSRDVFNTASSFYRKYYTDHNKRHLILGINPGRFGAGATGIPFTDTVRLKEICGLDIHGVKTHETSSVFVYDMIGKYGGPEKFYSDFYISSVSPLGFTKMNEGGKEVNYNYYDSKELTSAIYDFAVETIKIQIDFGICRDICFCFGTGKNYDFILKLNSKNNFFKRIEPLEHPRFIMQYKSAAKKLYIEKYIKTLKLIHQGDD